MLSIEHLYFSYQGQPPYVLNDFNLHIHSGDYISIVGDNGCGKSTLLRLILGFLTPVKGSIKRSTNNIRYVSQKNDFSHAGFPITSANFQVDKLSVYLSPAPSSVSLTSSSSMSLQQVSIEKAKRASMLYFEI